MNKIIIVSGLRSGTHLLKKTIEDFLGISDKEPILYTEEITLDKMKLPLMTFHYESLNYLSSDMIQQMNEIIEKENIYVIYLDRKNFNSQVLSITLAEKNSWSNNISDLFVRKFITKDELEYQYKVLYDLKRQKLENAFPLTFHQTLYYEDLADDNLIINGNKIKVSDAIKKNPNKTQSIENYESVCEWLVEFSKKYDIG